MKQRVVVLIRSLASGGAEKQALLLVQALQDVHDVQLLIVSDEVKSAHHLAFIEQHALRTAFLPRGGLRKLTWLRRFLKREEIDVLFSFLPGDTLVGALSGRLAGVPRIYGGLRNTHFARRKQAVLRVLHNHVLDSTISNSHRAAQLFGERGFRRDKLQVIPNGIPLVGSPTDRRGRKGVSLLTVARFVEKKDHHTALVGVAELVKNTPDAHLHYTIAGHGVLEGELGGWVRALGLQDVVDIVVDPPDVERLYRAADVYLCASRHEGLSNTVMEAMNHGLPIVATDVGDNSQLVQDGLNGRLAPPGDAAALCAYLAELVDSPALRERFGQASRARIEQHYSLDVFRDAYLRVLSDGPAAGAPQDPSADATERSPVLPSR